MDRGGYRKVFEGAMPLLGGLAIAGPLVLIGAASALSGYLIFLNWEYILVHHSEYFDPLFDFSYAARWEALVLTLGGAGILALGLIDDTRGMRARYKLAGQVLVALFVSVMGFAVSNITLPFVGSISLGLPLGILLTALWIVGLINAFNLIDGVDGLASGIALVGALSLVALSVIQGNAFVTLAGAALAGGLLAFLFVNFPPARMFLGDTGSMFLGYTLATMSLVGAQKSEAAVILVAPILALSFPIFETLISIVRRYLRGVPIFMGDNHHTHHRLLSKGYSQPRVVLTLCSVAAILAISAILASLAPEGSILMLASYGLFAATLGYIAWLAGYLRPTTFRRILERRRQNRVLHALSAYAALSLNGKGRAIKSELLLDLCRHELHLAHIEVQLANGDTLMTSDTRERATADCPMERLRVKSSDDDDLFVLFQYEDSPDENRRHDIAACLAAIFDQLQLDRTFRALELAAPPNIDAPAPATKSESRAGIRRG